MAIELDAPLIASCQAIPHLRAAGGGRIVNVLSLAALLPLPGIMSYGITKIGLERLTVDLAWQRPLHPATRADRGGCPSLPRSSFAWLNNDVLRQGRVAMDLKAGSRFRSATDTTEVVVVKAPAERRPSLRRPTDGRDRRGGGATSRSAPASAKAARSASATRTTSSASRCSAPRPVRHAVGRRRTPVPQGREAVAELGLTGTR